MARLVKHEKNRPYVFKKDEIEKETIAICACGLSQNKPFCDGSHKRTNDEEPGELYLYDDEGGRVKLPTEY